jgi:hypothetical protein
VDKEKKLQDLNVVLGRARHMARNWSVEGYNIYKYRRTRRQEDKKARRQEDKKTRQEDKKTKTNKSYTCSLPSDMQI